MREEASTAPAASAFTFEWGPPQPGPGVAQLVRIRAAKAGRGTHSERSAAAGDTPSSMALAPSARPWSQESASSPDKRIASRPPQQQPQLWPSAVLADVQGWHELTTSSTHVWGVPQDTAGTHRLGAEQALLRDMHGLTLGHSQFEAGAALNGNDTGLERGRGGQRHQTHGPAHRGHDVRRQRQAVVRVALMRTSNIHAEAQHLKRRALQVLDSVMAL
jgi:hypothetical protein